MINKSGDDIDDGVWTMILPDGVTYEKASINAVEEKTTAEGERAIVYNPLRMDARKKVIFSVNVKIDSATTSGRLVFRTFLNDFEAYCEATSAMTVRTFDSCPDYNASLFKNGNPSLVSFSLYVTQQLEVSSSSRPGLKKGAFSQKVLR